MNRATRIATHAFALGIPALDEFPYEVWRRLGAQVTIVEFLDHILPGIDGEVARQFHRLQQKQGLAFKLASKVTAIDASDKVLKVKVEPAAGSGVGKRPAKR